MSILEKKLEKMERRFRLYQIVFLSFMLAAAFFIVTAFNKKTSAPDLIQAKEFQVVDDNGKVYASMKQHDGFCDFKLYNSTGTQVIRLTESSNGYGTIITSDKRGTMACDITGTTGEAGGSLRVFNHSEKTVDEISVTDQGGGYMGVNNSSENPLFKVTYTTANYGGWLGLYNAYGKNIVKLSTATQGGNVTINNSDGNQQVSLDVSTYNDGLVSVYNRLNNRVCVLGGDASGNGVLNVLNSAGLNMNGVWPK